MTNNKCISTAISFANEFFFGFFFFGFRPVRCC